MACNRRNWNTFFIPIMGLILTMMFSACTIFNNILNRTADEPEAVHITAKIPSGTIIMTEDQYTTSSLTPEIQSRTFLFTVEEETRYHIWLYDFDALNTLVDGIMSARYSDGTVIYPYTDMAWTNQRQFTADRDGTVLITVIPHNMDCPFYRPGIFAIVFNTTGTRPDPPDIGRTTIGEDEP